MQTACVWRHSQAGAQHGAGGRQGRFRGSSGHQSITGHAARSPSRPQGGGAAPASQPAASGRLVGSQARARARARARRQAGCAGPSQRPLSPPGDPPRLRDARAQTRTKSRGREPRQRQVQSGPPTTTHHRETSRSQLYRAVINRNLFCEHSKSAHGRWRLFSSRPLTRKQAPRARWVRSGSPVPSSGLKSCTPERCSGVIASAP